MGRSLDDEKLGQVHHCDCIQGMNGLPAGSVNLVFADPPFNIGYEYDEYRDRLDSEKYLEWSNSWMSAVHRVLSDSGAFWLAIGDEFAAELKIKAQEIGFHTRSWVVWYYTFGVHCKTKFTRSHAHLFHFVKEPERFVFNAQEVAVPSARQLVYGDKRANPSGRVPDDTWILRPQDCVDGFTADEDTWYFPRIAGTFKERAGFHGCQMPEQLLGRIIRSCSNPGDVVLDPFAGSCTTLVVAKKTGRQFLGFELSKEYVRLGSDRINGVSVGDSLEGSPEPKATAPSTNSVKARRLQNSAPEFEGFLPGMLELVAIDSETDGIVQAFSRSNRGYSVDRLVADPLLNEDFQRQCDRLDLPGTPAERNRFLFRVRKSGRLKQANIATTKRTNFTWEEMDAYLFAAEIAWRRVSELYADASLDEILCDPRLAKMFDETASSFAAGYSPLEYRWAALKLRKQRSSAIKRATTSTARSLGICKFKESDLFPFSSLDINSYGVSAGVYAIHSRDLFLYVGETANLKGRLGLQLSDAARERWPAHYRDPLTLQIAVKCLPEIANNSRLARQSCLLKWYQPLWNFNLQISL